MSDADLELLRTDAGTLEERRWRELEWEQPMDEACSCWWVANAYETDKSQATKLVCRSLAVLRLELQQNRIASTDKLKREWERRLDDNGRSVDVLLNNMHLWSHVDGPHPEDLRAPSEVALLEAKQCCEALARMAEAHGNAQTSCTSIQRKSPRRLMP